MQDKMNSRQVRAAFNQWWRERCQPTKPTSPRSVRRFPVSLMTCAAMTVSLTAWPMASR